MLFVVLIAGHTWWQGGTGPIRGSSSATASWMDPSVSEAAGGTGAVVPGRCVRPQRTRVCVTRIHLRLRFLQHQTSPGGHHQLQPGDGLDESRVPLTQHAWPACAVQLGDGLLNGPCRLNTPVS